MNFPQIAQQVIDKLGGKENIATAAHCCNAFTYCAKR